MGQLLLSKSHSLLALSALTTPQRTPAAFVLSKHHCLYPTSAFSLVTLRSSSSLSTSAARDDDDMSPKKKVLVPIADGSEEIETACLTDKRSKPRWLGLRRTRSVSVAYCVRLRLDTLYLLFFSFLPLSLICNRRRTIISGTYYNCVSWNLSSACTLA